MRLSCARTSPPFPHSACNLCVHRMPSLSSLVSLSPVCLAAYRSLALCVSRRARTEPAALEEFNAVGRAQMTAAGSGCDE